MRTFHSLAWTKRQTTQVWPGNATGEWRRPTAVYIIIHTDTVRLDQQRRQRRRRPRCYRETNPHDNINIILSQPYVRTIYKILLFIQRSLMKRYNAIINNNIIMYVWNIIPPTVGVQFSVRIWHEISFSCAVRLQSYV